MVRNLRQYPITTTEMADAIKRASDMEVARLNHLPEADKPIGDIHLAALERAEKLIRNGGNPHRQIYLDCDGVLADFEKKATEVFGMNPRKWEAKRALERFEELLAKQLDSHQTVDQKKLEQEALALASKDFWEKLYATQDLFEILEPMPDAFELYEAVKHLDPIILTGCPRGYWAVAQKMRWRDKFFPGVPMICLASADKRAHCRPGDILIDDWHRYSGEWEEKGGVFILHTSARESIAALRELGILP